MFYHRCTNNTDFSRQACAEPIEIEADGTIRQVEITTQGLCGKPLSGAGIYPAALCCNLITPKPVRLGLGKQQRMPRIAEKDGDAILADLTAGTKAVYKYIDLRHTKTVTVKYRGDGVLAVNGRSLDGGFSAPLSGGEREAVTIEVLSGKLDILSFTLE